MTNANDVSVVVCMYDRARWREIRLCLDSLGRQTYAPAQVIAVVDGHEELAEDVRRAYPEVTLVALPQNRGLSAARNAGTEQVDTPWVAFLDDDAYAEPDWLEKLVEAREASGAVGVGGWVEPVFMADNPGWFPEELLWTVGCSHAGLPRERELVRNVFGGCALMSVDALRDNGGYDPAVGRRGDDAAGGEEADLCLRILQTQPDARFVLEPSAVIHHHVPPERARRGYVLRRCFVDGRAKAGIARRRGAGSLSSESDFAKAVLPRLGQHLRARRPGAAWMLFAGTGVAGVGFVRGLAASMGGRRAGASAAARPDARQTAPAATPATAANTAPGTRATSTAAADADRTSRATTDREEVTTCVS
ncbi:MAG: glycosyltransferase family 2 protein [Dermatophilaceae bacterium]